MANTKVTQHVIANNAITADQIASAAVTDAKLHATLDLSGKTLTLPATAIPSASTGTTQSASDNSTKLATTAYVTTAIANLNDSAPSALNTLNELAAALNDDASFSSTITTALGTKLPLAGGTLTGDLILGDNIILEIGSGSGGDLRLYHDGNNSAIQNTTGDLFIYGGTNEIRLRAKNDEESLVAFPNGKVELYFDNASKLETTTTGVSILGTGALKIPVGTTGQRPTAATGQLRFNSTDGKLEIYNGSAWANVSAGTSNKVLDTFTGDNSTTAFTLTETPANEDALMVFINGAYQEKGDYSLSGKVLTLDVAPLSGEKVAVHTTIGSVHDGTAALNQQFTGDGSTTAFTLSVDPQHENNTQVYINGVYQQKTDYTVSGTTLTFDTAPTSGDIIEVNSFTVTTLGGSDSVTEGVSNLYHTTARARSAISVSGNALSYNSSSGVLTANFEESPSFTGDVTVTSGTSGKPHLNLINTNADSSAPVLNFKKDSASPADNDEVGRIYMYGDDDGGNPFEAFLAIGKSTDVSNGNENSSLDMYTYSGGAQSATLSLKEGNVGIGTTSPGQKLEVAGNLFINTSGNPNLTVKTSGAGNNPFIKLQADSNAWDIQSTFSNTNDELFFMYNSSTKMAIDNSGKVGIGTSSPGSALHVEKSFDGTLVEIHQTRGSASTDRGLDVETSSTGTTVARFKNSGMVLQTIYGNGNVAIFGGTLYVAGDGQSFSAGSHNGHSYNVNGQSVSSRAANNLQTHHSFYNTNGNVGTIKTNASATQFNTSSDYRLKENVVTDWDGTTLLKQLKPSQFNFKADSSTIVQGFLAHEVSSIVPQAVSGDKDAVYTAAEAEDGEGIEGQPNYQGIDHSHLVPLLVKTIQELEARIATLEG